MNILFFLKNSPQREPKPKNNSERAVTLLKIAVCPTHPQLYQFVRIICKELHDHFDVMMTKMNGLEFTDCVKQDERTKSHSRIPDYRKADGNSRMQGFKKGADDYLAKGFTL